MNKFRCVLLFLTSFSLLFGIFLLVVSCLTIEKIGKDFLSDKGDICAAVGTAECSDKKQVYRVVENPVTDIDGEEECGDSCGFLTCPGFSLNAKSSKLCSLICTCKQGRSAAASIALCVGIFQTIFGAVYLLLVFIHNAWIKTRSFRARWLAFVISHAVFLALSILSLTLAMVFHMADKPSNLDTVFNSDENFEGTIFLVACSMDLTLCLFAIIVVMIFRKVIKNPEDENALCGKQKSQNVPKDGGAGNDKQSLSSSQKKTGAAADGSGQSIHPSQSSQKTNNSSTRKKQGKSQTSSGRSRSQSKRGKNQVRPQPSSTSVAANHDENGGKEKHT